MTKTVYLELQEIKANSEAILFSIHQLEEWLDRHEQGQLKLDFSATEAWEEKSPGAIGA